MIRTTRRALVAAPALLAGLPALAQSSQPLTLLVGYAAGGSADLVSRALAAGLGPRLRRTVVVENVAGASGILAFQRLLGGRTDGSAIYLGGLDTLVVPMVNRSIRLDWKRDTVPVARTTIGSLTFVVPASSPHRDMAGFLAAARAAGDEAVSYGTPGVATIQHFMGEAISARGGVRLLHAPYRGGNLVVNDLMSGNLASAVLVTSTALPPVQQGTLRALAVSSAARLPQLPEVPTLSELPGFDGVTFPLWQGLFLRAGTSDAVVAGFDAAVRDTLAAPQVRSQLDDAGFEAAYMSRTEFTPFIEEQAAVYRQLIDTAGIRLE
jgi:tripartite-type tricarboxylate transporter receptor subunit TctC